MSEPTHTIHFEAASMDDGDAFLFKLVHEGLLSKEDYSALWTRGDEFLVYSQAEADKVLDLAGDALETGIEITEVEPYVTKERSVADLSDTDLEKELSFALGADDPTFAATEWLSKLKTEAALRGLWSESGIRCRTCQEFIEFDVERNRWIEVRRIPYDDQCSKAIDYLHRPEED